MYKLCKTEQSAQRQRQLEEGLQELMRIRPYDEISVVDICEHLNIPRKSFYRYFSSKEGALHALIDHTLMEYEGCNFVYRAGENRTLHRELIQFFQFWIQKKGFLDVLSRSHMSGMLVERSMAHATSANGMPVRFLPNDTPDTRRQLILFCISGLMSTVLTWHHEGYPTTPEQMASIAERLLSQPLFPNMELLL